MKKGGPVKKNAPKGMQRTGMAQAPQRKVKLRWGQIALTSGFIASAGLLGRFMLPHIERNVPIKPAHAVIEVVKPPVDAKSAKERPKPTPTLVPTATPEPPPIELNSDMIEHWARAVTLEVPDAPEEVRRRVAKTVVTRRHMPGWYGRSPEDIITPNVYQGLTLRDQDSRLRQASSTLEANRKLVREVANEPVGPTDPTHFFTPITFKTDSGGRLLRDKEGNLIPLRLKLPKWAEKGVHVGTAVWTSPYGTKKEIAFYRLDA